MCTDVWVDVFRCLGRKDLLQKVQLVGRRFDAICERLLHTVHVISQLTRFLEELERGSPTATKQMSDVRAGRVDLAKHFRVRGSILFKMRTTNEDAKRTAHFEHRFRAQMDLLRLFPAFFQNLTIESKTPNSKKITNGEHLELDRQHFARLFEALECSSIRPLSIRLFCAGLPWDQFSTRRLFLRCPQLILFQNTPVEQDAKGLAGWLHQTGARGQQRLLGIHFKISLHNCEALVRQCVQHFHASTEQHPFLLWFCNCSSPIEPFSVENARTGEVLMLENVDGIHLLRRSPWELEEWEKFNETLNGTKAKDVGSRLVLE